MINFFRYYFNVSYTQITLQNTGLCCGKGFISIFAERRSKMNTMVEEIIELIKQADEAQLEIILTYVKSLLNK